MNFEVFSDVRKIFHGAGAMPLHCTLLLFSYSYDLNITYLIKDSGNAH